MSNEIVTFQHENFLPVMNLEIAIQRRNQLVSFVQGMMVVDHDYGKIPGTDKNVLLKPGAEKLVTFFGLTPVFVPTATIQDWTGEAHGGESLFYYRYKCELYRQGYLMATGEGSCSSRESKYRYRKGERVCPNCEAATIYKSKDAGQGFFCWKKKGGCGAVFGEKDARIIGQEVGRVLNPDVADLDNTILKMAQKRALIQAVLLGVNASEFFTQDMEDFVDIEVTVVNAENLSQSGQVGQEKRLPRASEAQRNRLHQLGTEIYGDGWDDARHMLIEKLTTGATTTSNDLTPNECAMLIAQMEFNQLGDKLYGEQWAQVGRHNAERITGGKAVEPGALTLEQINKLIDGMKKLQRKRNQQPVTNGESGDVPQTSH